MKIVYQRKGKDCLIACCATATGNSYGHVCSLIGVTFDPIAGPATVPDDLSPIDFIFPLYKLGWHAILLAASEKIEGRTAGAYATSDQLKSLIDGQLAIVGYEDPDPSVGPHALVWDGSQLIDCGNGTNPALSSITLEAVLLLVRKTGSEPRDDSLEPSLSP